MLFSVNCVNENIQFYMLMSSSFQAQEIRSLYEIKVETQVQCSQCSFIQREPNSLFSLPLAIRESENTLVNKLNIHQLCFVSTSVIPLYCSYVLQERCINSYFQLQNLENGEEHYCNQCEQKQPSTHVCAFRFFFVIIKLYNIS